MNIFFHRLSTRWMPTRPSAASWGGSRTMFIWDSEWTDRNSARRGPGAGFPLLDGYRSALRGSNGSRGQLQRGRGTCKHTGGGGKDMRGGVPPLQTPSSFSIPPLG